MNLSSTIKSIQDIMRKDDGVDGDAQRIGQLSWMLYPQDLRPVRGDLGGRRRRPG